MKRNRVKLGASLALVGFLGLTACSDQGASTNEGSNPSADPEKPITLTYTGWVNAMDEAVAEWNKANPGIQVEYSPAANGSEVYPKVRAAVQAGNASCLSQITYDNFASFVSDGMLLDVSEYASQYQDQYLDYTWNLVTFAGSTYGIPQDTGPMVMFYRADVFEEIGIEVPTTWEEFEAAARVVREKLPEQYLAFFAPDQSVVPAGYAWQNGAQWFLASENGWELGLNDDATMEIANYWQNLIDEDLVEMTKRGDPTFFSHLASDRYLTLIDGAWANGLFIQNVESQAGDWRVAPMPQGGVHASANAGGSAVAVLKGCEHPKEALEFAHWLNSSEESFAILGDSSKGGLYPAAVAALEYPIVNQPISYFGDQVIGDVFRESANGVSQTWQWGPTYSSTNIALKDNLAKVQANQSTVPEVFNELQELAIADMEQRGITVLEK